MAAWGVDAMRSSKLIVARRYVAVTSSSRCFGRTPPGPTHSPGAFSPAKRKRVFGGKAP